MKIRCWDCEFFTSDSAFDGEDDHPFYLCEHPDGKGVCPLLDLPNGVGDCALLDRAALREFESLK